MRDEAPLRPWLTPLLAAVGDVRLFDAHTHTGDQDPDGVVGRATDLVAALERLDARAVVFTSQAPDGYAAANDRVLAEAAEAGPHRLVPFCRVDPARWPATEAERCLDAGARGIKLHPRAEGFAMDHPGVREVFAVAEERSVPIIVHSGRGIPALGVSALHLCEAHPGAPLILAHAAVSDLAWLWREVGSVENLYFDTSWWSPADLLALFALVPPGRVLFASDTPYGNVTGAAIMLLRCALQAGLSAEQIRGVAGGQLDRLVAGATPLDLGPAVGPVTEAIDPLLERVVVNLVAGLGRLLAHADADESLSLARLACAVPDDHAVAPVARAVGALLDRFDEAVAAPPDPHDDEAPLFAPGTEFVVTALAVARTPAAPLPDLPERDGGGASVSAPVAASPDSHPSSPTI